MTYRIGSVFLPVELCKEAWRKIKLAYQNSQRHARSKVNADGSIRKPYYLHKQMTFYEPHLRARDVMNQLVKVDQQAAQERNQKNHSSSGVSTGSLSPQPQPLNLQSRNSMSSPDSFMSHRSNEDCNSPLALDSRVSVIESYVTSPNPIETTSTSGMVATESSLLTSQPMTSLPPFVTTSLANQMLPPPPTASDFKTQTERVLKRKLESEFYVPQHHNGLSAPKQPHLVAQTGHLPFNGHISPVEQAQINTPATSVPQVSIQTSPVASTTQNMARPTPITDATPPPLEVDADLQFLLSLHADIKSLNYKQKFGFKRKVYALMEEILNGQNDWKVFTLLTTQNIEGCLVVRNCAFT